MALNVSELPSYLSALPGLDFTDDLTREPLEGPWFRLAECTSGYGSRKDRIESACQRECLLIPTDAFPCIFDGLSAVGNTFEGLGMPTGFQEHDNDVSHNGYRPFHEFDIGGMDVTAEPVAFIRRNGSRAQIILNPDLWLFLELEERGLGSGIWWDARRGVEAIKMHNVYDDILVIDIRTTYLKRYLKARQMSLLVGHYQHSLLFDPSPTEENEFGEKEDRVLGAPERGIRVVLNNWGLRKDVCLDNPFLQRRLHYWFVVKPPDIYMSDPCEEELSFDPYTFTLPTQEGPVAPARFRHFNRNNEREYTGESVDFRTPVFFRQEVLVKYEHMVGFKIDPNGSLHCGDYWGLCRSTARIGNDLLRTMIGDFAEEVPFDEWLYWQQYAVQHPSAETLKALSEEISIPDAITRLNDALSELSVSFGKLASACGVDISKSTVWDSSLESLAGKQLQWVYSAAADEVEFLTRGTLLSTFVIDGLNASLIRKVLISLSSNLHETFDDQQCPLGSRKLLQRLVLCSQLLDKMCPSLEMLGVLIRKAETTKEIGNGDELTLELIKAYEQTKELLSPLAFLYDLRIYGGIAHKPNAAQAAHAAVQLGLPESGWQRQHYLKLVKLVTDSLWSIAKELENGACALIQYSITARNMVAEGGKGKKDQI